MTETVTIDYLGGLGDGVANMAGGRLHIPLTAPGDVAEVRITGKESAELITLTVPGPNRAPPPCIHFGRCGGCALQHLKPAFTADWKRARIVTALGRAGLGDIHVAQTISIPPGTRRRATLAAKRFGSRIRFGFTERASHRLVDLTECWVLRPELVRIIAPVRDALANLLTETEGADIALTLTEIGIDLTLVRQRPLTLSDREILAALAEALDLACITWRPSLKAPAEPVAMRRTPRVRFGVHAVSLPSGSFLQPSIEGEFELTLLVLAALGGTTGPIVDIFSGLGTFTLPASAIGPISAYDSDAQAIAALKIAIRAMPAVTATQRDLFREPLTVKELEPFTVAIIDPPRAGAQAQSAMLARSGVATIAAVSCNPVSFARDAAILAAGGYRLKSVTPIDQFLWSPHIELMGDFRR